MNKYRLLNQGFLLIPNFFYFFPYILSGSFWEFFSTIIYLSLSSPRTVLRFYLLSLYSFPPTGFDNRILKGISRLGYIYPSYVQYQALPLGLQGKDLLIKAKTGSGKTATYGLLAIHKVLTSKLAMNERTPGGKVRALILVPTRELVDQTTSAIDSLAYYCADLVHVCGIGGNSNNSNTGSNNSSNETLAKLRELPDIIVSTPGKLIPYLQGKYSKYFTSSSSSSSNLLGTTEMFIIDEADLVLSHGYKEDIHTIINYLPRLIQSILLSATLSTGLDDLKALVLHNPVILKVDDSFLFQGNGGNNNGNGNNTTVTGLLTQLYVRIPRNDRYLLLYALIKLQLLIGKSLIFTNTTDTCVKIKLLLDKFSIPSAVLNAELPANSRAHIIDQFNKGIFDILLATDEGLRRSGNTATSTSIPNSNDDEVLLPEDSEKVTEDSTIANNSSNTKTKKEKAGKTSKKRQRTAEEDIDNTEEIDQTVTTKTGKTQTSTTATTNTTTVSTSLGPVESEEFEFLVSRGLDFKGVTTVINFDFPDNAVSYIHRIGRTARGGASGVALSFLPPVGVEIDKDQVLDELQRQQPLTLDTGAPQPTPFPFDIKEIETFRYRVEGIVRSITPHAIKEARLAELKRELLASQTLRAHFEDNPKDLAILQHARPLHVNSLNSLLSNRGNMAHLKNVPTYLLPPSLKLAVEAAGGGLNASGIQTNTKKARTNNNSNKNNNARNRSNDTLSVLPPKPLIPTDGSMPVIMNPSDAIAVSKHDAYSARRVGSKMDPLRTFTYNAQLAASKGIPSMTSLSSSANTHTYTNASSSSVVNYGNRSNYGNSSTNRNRR